VAESKVEYSNLLSRILLKSIQEQQFMAPAPPPARQENLMVWYERNILRVDVSSIAVDRPIFLLGMYRSGTTVLQDILCSHPQTAYITNTMHKFRRGFCGVEALRQRFNLNFRMERYLQDSVQVEASSPNEGYLFWQEWLKEDAYSLDYQPRSWADFSPADIEHINTMIARVIWCFDHQGQDKRFFSKNPALLPYTPLLSQLFPTAKFIHIVRDPRMCCNSMLKFYQLSQTQLANIKKLQGCSLYDEHPFIPYPRFPRLKEYIENYGPEDIRTTAHLWNDGVDLIEASKNKIANFYEVRYEDILAHPQEKINQILDFCELTPMGSQNHKFQQQLRQVGQVPHTSNNKYDNFEVVESICQANMALKGYG
jgi:hypothetical protein